MKSVHYGEYSVSTEAREKQHRCDVDAVADGVLMPTTFSHRTYTGKLIVKVVVVKVWNDQEKRADDGYEQKDTLFKKKKKKKKD